MKLFKKTLNKCMREDGIAFRMGSLSPTRKRPLSRRVSPSRADDYVGVGKSIRDFSLPLVSIGYAAWMTVGTYSTFRQKTSPTKCWMIKPLDITFNGSPYHGTLTIMHYPVLSQTRQVSI